MVVAIAKPSERIHNTIGSLSIKKYYTSTYPTVEEQTRRK